MFTKNEILFIFFNKFHTLNIKKLQNKKKEAVSQRPLF